MCSILRRNFLLHVCFRFIFKVKQTNWRKTKWTKRKEKSHSLAKIHKTNTHSYTHTHAHSLKFQFELFGMGMARTKLNEMLMKNWALIISFRRFFLFLFRLVVYFFSPVKSPTPPIRKFSGRARLTKSKTSNTSHFILAFLQRPHISDIKNTRIQTFLFLIFFAECS